MDTNLSGLNTKLHHLNFIHQTVFSFNRPRFRENLGLLQHGLRRLSLFIGRMTKLMQDTLSQGPEPDAEVFAQRPVYRDVVTEHLIIELEISS